VQTGTYISGLGHVAVIGWVILGSVLSEKPSVPEFRVTEVSLVSKAELDAVQSSSPRPAQEVTRPALVPDNTVAPRAPAPVSAVPLRPRKEALPPQQKVTPPDLSALKNPVQATAQVDAPEFAAQPSVTEQGATLIMPTAPIAPVAREGLTRPDRPVPADAAEAPSPRIDTTPAPAPAPDARTAPRVEKATRPDRKATGPDKPRIETAPRQASTRIVTEAIRKKKTAAPLRSSRPRGRPARLAEKARAARDIAAALAAAQRASAPAPAPPPPAPSGPPLTGAERDALRLAVQECWNVNPSSESARITVVVGVSMERNGKPRAGTIRLISATDGSDAAKQSAFDAARRAILRCGVKGYKLPVAKYDRWRNIEMTFNPEKMRIK